MGAVINPYIEFMQGNLSPDASFTEFLQVHKEYVAENLWTEHDQLAALYVLSRTAVENVFAARRRKAERSKAFVTEKRAARRQQRSDEDYSNDVRQMPLGKDGEPLYRQGQEPMRHLTL